MAYLLGLRGVVVGEGDTSEGAMPDVMSAIRFHLDTFGKDVLAVDSPVLEAFWPRRRSRCNDEVSPERPQKARSQKGKKGTSYIVVVRSMIYDRSPFFPRGMSRCSVQCCSILR